MFKKANVVMLPTNEKANIHKIGNELGFTSIQNVNFLAKQQHLYITSDEEIKEGDWFYDKVLNVVTNTDKYVDFKYINQTDNCEKVISSTNPKLIINIGGDTLPQPSQLFITKYIEEYNKGNVINEVMVKYEESENCFDSREGSLSESNIKLKINSKDNTITIKKIKDSWTREEVERLLSDGIGEAISYPEHFVTGICLDNFKVNNWISKNL